MVSVQIFNMGGKKKKKKKCTFNLISPFSVNSKGNVVVSCDFVRISGQFHQHPISACIQVPVQSWHFGMSFNLNLLSVFCFGSLCQLFSLIGVYYAISIFPFKIQAKPEYVDL